MTVMKHALSFLLLLTLLVLTACSDAPSTTATATASPPTSTPIPSPTPSATPLPEIVFTSLNLLPGLQPGDWRVVGLVENRSDVNLIDAHIVLTLLDSSGNPLGEAHVPITHTHLAPSETSPFRATFSGAGLAADVQASLSSFRTEDFQRQEIESDILNTTRTEQGSVAILATISNPSESPVSIAAFALLAQNDLGRPVGLANQVAGPAVLRGGETATVLALLEIDAGVTTYAPFVDAVTADLMPDPQPISLAGQTKLVLDSQGNPFVVGTLQNSAQQPLTGSVLLTIAYHDEWISSAHVNTTVPLGPGEMRPFTATDFPALSARLDGETWSLRDLELEARVDPPIAGSESVPSSHLGLSIHSFEAIGGFAFIQGTVTNPYDNPMQSASVLASLHTTRGSLVTASWTTVSEKLLAGESVDFVLPIPMPANSYPRLSEFDIWAVGVQTP